LAASEVNGLPLQGSPIEWFFAPVAVDAKKSIVTANGQWWLMELMFHRLLFLAQCRGRIRRRWIDGWFVGQRHGKQRRNGRYLDQQAWSGERKPQEHSGEQKTIGPLSKASICSGRDDSRIFTATTGGVEFDRCFRQWKIGLRVKILSNHWLYEFLTHGTSDGRRNCFFYSDKRCGDFSRMNVLQTTSDSLGFAHAHWTMGTVAGSEQTCEGGICRTCPFQQ
jgi:hypothetical protein